MDLLPSDFIPKRKPAPGAQPEADIVLFKGVTRPAYRAPVGVPPQSGKGLGGKASAVGLHLLLILLLFAPLASPEIRKELLGAGGPGPAGGGGGGNRGTGGGSHKTERTTYVQVVPPPPPKTTITPQLVPPPVVKPPVVPPPVVTPPPVVKPPVETKSEVNAVNDKPAADVASVSTGTGGGRGTDGSVGNGTGSGGGTGSGIGTGRGTGVGAGTGGGSGTIYPPTPTELFIPPMPPPAKIKGFELIATFDVDSTGKVLDLQFTQTKDGAYNNKLREILRSVRFRPGVNGLGVAIRATTQIIYTF